MNVTTKKQIKFERIRNRFGCGYYGVCCRNHCPCEYKRQEELNENIYQTLKAEFDNEGKLLFGS